MQFFILVLLVCLVLFLYRIYHLANDDYVLIKKNITLEDIFNAVFACSLVSLLFSRLFYVLMNPDPVFINPLGFLLFPYFPGLSITGAILGGAFALFFFCRRKKIPRARVFDFFSMAFIFVLPFGFLGYFLLSQDFTTGTIVKFVLYSLILFASNIYLYPKASSLEIKDGTISALFLVFFSLISLLSSAIDNPGTSYFLTHKENFILAAILFISMGIIIKQELTGRISIKNGR